MLIAEQSTNTRVEEMHALYASGATLEEVATEFGVTRERVRQILRHHGYELRSRGEAHAVRQARIRAEIDRAAPRVIELHSSGHEVNQIADELGISKSAVERVVREDELSRLTKESERRARMGRGATKIYSNDEMLACLREASDSLGGILSTGAYREFARQRTFEDGRAWPGPQSIFGRFGSWVDALQAAGLAANPRSAIAGQRVFEESHCIDAVRYVGRELGKPPTANAYDEMARASSGGLPSLATVRNRCGGWISALTKAGY